MERRPKKRRRKRIRQNGEERTIEGKRRICEVAIEEKRRKRTIYHPKRAEK